MKTILVDAWNTFVTEDGINREMKKMLDEFTNTKIILTNADDVKQKELGLVDLPYEIFSLNFDPLKTHPDFYTIFLEKYNLEVSDVIYFEHNIEAVKSAQSVGIETFHYNKNEKNIEKLKYFLEKNV